MPLDDETLPSGPAYPFLKWAGGKGRVIPYLDPVFPTSFGAYHEPFLGAGAVFFHLAATRPGLVAHLSDLNEDLVATFQAVRDRTQELILALKKLQLAHDEDHYYAARDRLNAGKLDLVGRAALMIYLNRTGFNGLYRVNARGGFNVPFGRYEKPRICDPAGLRLAAAALRSATVEARDFATVLGRAKKGDLVYLDPPYDPLSRTAKFTSYARMGFGPIEQERLAEVFRALDDKGVHVVLSNHDTPLVRKLYGEYSPEVVQVGRLINSKVSRRSDTAPEVIVVGRTAARAVARPAAKAVAKGATG